jgi:hypothetical protein
MSQALLVGFDAPVLALCARHLAGRGITARTATSLARAREMLRSAPPAFCIVDGDLASGEASRAVDFALEMRVPVALVGGAPPHDVDDLGPFLHLDKPLSTSALDRIVECFPGRIAEDGGRPLIGR